MDEFELAVHEIKNGIEKNNIKKITQLDNFERDIEGILTDVDQTH
jgi:hypothetical protein